MEAFLGVVIGVLSSLGVVTYVKTLRSKKLVNSQSVLLLDKIKKVCKFITVEGDFAEIYHYEDVKARFLKMLTSKKKALVVIKAKAHVGYDLSKIIMEANTDKKIIILKNFPEPEVLSIETDLNYYDMLEHMFNRFSSSDLTGLQQQAKDHIMEKIPESGLIEIAQKEALETVLLIETIVQTIGWKLDYSALVIADVEPKKINKE